MKNRRPRNANKPQGQKAHDQNPQQSGHELPSAAQHPGGKPPRKGGHKPGGKKPQQRQNRGQTRNRQNDPYDNLPAGKNIVTKRPPWEPNEGTEEWPAANTRPAGKPRQGQSEQEKRLAGSISRALQRKRPSARQKANDKNLYDFSEAELREDTSLQVISRAAGTEVKYASFEEYLQKTQGEDGEDEA